MTVIDIVNKSNQHLYFNLAVIRGLECHTKLSGVITLADNNLSRNGVFVNPVSDPIHAYFQIIKSKPNRLLFLAVDSRSLILSCILLLFRFEVRVLSHSFLQTLRIGGLKHKIVLLLFTQLGGKILVNSRGIANRAQSSRWLRTNSVVNVGHPLRKPSFTWPNLAGKIKISFIGHVHKNKGWDLFQRLAEKFSGDYDFLLNGMRFSESSRQQPAEMSDAEYLKSIEAADCIFCFYPIENYDLYPSGTLLDAISCNRPVLASKTPFSQDVFGGDSESVLLDGVQLFELLSSRDRIKEFLLGQIPVIQKTIASISGQGGGMYWNKIV
jgi:hypothetical protein